MRSGRVIELVTSDQHHVAWVEIAPFPTLQQSPAVVLWGSRVFERLGLKPEGVWAYREVFAVVSLTPSPGIDPAELNLPSSPP